MKHEVIVKFTVESILEKSEFEKECQENKWIIFDETYFPGRRIKNGRSKILDIEFVDIIRKV